MMTLIYDKPANYTQDMKATVAKPSPRGDGHDVIEVEPKDADGNQLFTGENPGVIAVNGSFATIKSAPVNGVKTISTTAAEIFAGASRLASRYQMVVYNDSSNIIYWGAAGVTTATGFPLMPGDSVAFTFDTTIATPIYMVSSAPSSVRVGELA